MLSLYSIKKATIMRNKLFSEASSDISDRLSPPQSQLPQTELMGRRGGRVQRRTKGRQRKEQGKRQQKEWTDGLFKG